MIDVAAIALSGLLRLGLPVFPGLPDPGLALPRLAAPGPASYRSDDKSVSTWRDGTARTLEPAPLAIAAAVFELGRPVVSRCVKLNNPWCIKRARWPGELAGDDEGHTAFASTEFGADAAANLLRTYYITHGRKSALDIVRRWAPAECHIGIGGMSISLAVGGLAGTLRARYLAATGGRGGGRPVVSRTSRGGVSIKAPPGGRVRMSIVPLPKMPSYRVPSLTLGGGERGGSTASREPAPSRTAPARSRQAAAAPAASRRATPTRAAPTPAARAASVPAMQSVSGCGSAEGRIQNYAGAISRALGLQPGSDLKLFDAAGQPTVNLLPVMVAMSAVELGYLHASAPLAEAAIERLKAKLTREATEAAAREENRMSEPQPGMQQPGTNSGTQ